ncbi:uncharacterized protein LOC123661922 [Melitaea cinxia]|uniref:uncharacterized protein LOC123660451 n=1 Tax=Melitaea cinxia TaxID=113334 RepID=UPI001E274843|nr:uncharacterized protein LOC123660451 [Melitaea cinxia]XP_045452596.1 uncharacterized protein LOC123661688 [Melitaea cinxia]XP_045452812.1 uncharacterized protein LOC123661922 [Melitaea cinxia]
MQGESDGDEEERSVKSISGKKRRITTPTIDKYKTYTKNGYTRQYPDNSSNGDFVVYLEHLDREIKLGNMNPLNLSKYFKNIKGVHERARINSNKIKISFKQAALANDFLKSRCLLEHNLRAYIPASSVERVGVIRYIPKEIGNKELFEKICCDRDVVGIRRFMKREKGNLIPLSTISITFSGTSLPEYILLDGWRYKVHTYIPPLLQCFKCLKFNHSAKICRSEQVCSKCSENHSYKDCSSETLKCTNCSGNHLAISKDCPIKAARILKHRQSYAMATINKDFVNFPALPKSSIQKYTGKVDSNKNIELPHVPTKTDNFNISDIVNNTKVMNSIIKTLVALGNSESIKTTSHIKEIFIKNLSE